MLIWILLIGVPMLFGLYAQMRVMSAYNKNVQIPSRGRITGREAAAAVMAKAGIHDVEIVRVEGQLTDHYDPMNKRLALSEHNYDGTSLAALGVAAHEAGHAIQHKVGYSMMKVRQTLVPAVQIAQPISSWVVMAGILLISFAGKSAGGFGWTLVELGAIAMAVLCLFQLVTLPVEFDASRRAKAELVGLGIIDRDEMDGVKETLDAAALTYIAGFVAALGSLLHLLMILNGRRDE
jgi:Zn-dependent membrane protease YugP